MVLFSTAAFFSASIEAASRCATEMSIVSPLVWFCQRHAMPCSDLAVAAADPAFGVQLVMRPKFGLKA